MAPIHGLPVTTPLRTLRDIASLASLAELERAVAEAETRRLVTPAQLADITGPGAPRLRAVIKRDPAFTRSEAERRLLALIRQARLPRPKTNTRLAGHEVDFHWPDQRLVVEVDGYAFHVNRKAFEVDRIRDADLLEDGQRVLRVTWRQISHVPAAVVARLARALMAP